MLFSLRLVSAAYSTVSFVIVTFFVYGDCFDLLAYAAVSFLLFSVGFRYWALSRMRRLRIVSFFRRCSLFMRSPSRRDRESVFLRLSAPSPDAREFLRPTDRHIGNIMRQIGRWRFFRFRFSFFCAPSSPPMAPSDSRPSGLGARIAGFCK